MEASLNEQSKPTGMSFRLVHACVHTVVYSLRFIQIRSVFLKLANPVGKNETLKGKREKGRGPDAHLMPDSTCRMSFSEAERIWSESE